MEPNTTTLGGGQNNPLPTTSIGNDMNPKSTWTLNPVTIGFPDRKDFYLGASVFR